MQVVLCSAYFAVLLLLAMYGLHRSHLVLTCLRFGKNLRALREGAPRLPLETDPAALPHVTIQLPLYNEATVVARLLEQTARMAYPREKLEIQVLDDALRASEDDIAKLQAKLREARTKQANVQTRLESANNRYKLREMYAGAKTQDAFSRFDVLERRVDDAEGRAEALGLGTVKTLDEEIAELRSSDRVDAELEALKARIAKREG